jgi:hypothetical protein
MKFKYDLEEPPPFLANLVLGLQWAFIAISTIVILGKIVGSIYFGAPAPFNFRTRRCSTDRRSLQPGVPYLRHQYINNSWGCLHLHSGCYRAVQLCPKTLYSQGDCSCAPADCLHPCADNPGSHDRRIEWGESYFEHHVFSVPCICHVPVEQVSFRNMENGSHYFLHVWRQYNLLFDLPLCIQQPPVYASIMGEIIFR